MSLELGALCLQDVMPDRMNDDEKQADDGRATRSGSEHRELEL